jgi:hypothetical protein
LPDPDRHPGPADLEPDPDLHPFQPKLKINFTDEKDKLSLQLIKVKKKLVFNMCKTWGRIWIGIKIESRIRIQISKRCGSTTLLITIRI